jgi:hypothetical protein
VIKGLAVIGVVFAICLFGLYQGFVTQTHTPFTLKTFFSPAFWQAVKTKSWSKDPEFLSCAEIQSPVNIFIYQDKNLFSSSCKNGCTLTLKDKDAASSQWPTSIPIISQRDMKFDDNLQSVELLGADLVKHRLLYKTVDPTPFLYYVEVPSDGNQHMWQEVNLSPNLKDQIEFVAIKRSRDQQDYLVVTNVARHELYLYSLDSLWLRKIALPQNEIPDSQQQNDSSNCIKVKDIKTGEVKNWAFSK